MPLSRPLPLTRHGLPHHVLRQGGVGQPVLAAPQRALRHQPRHQSRVLGLQPGRVRLAGAADGLGCGMQGGRRWRGAGVAR